MEERDLSQILLTDSEAKLMKSKNEFIVAYNVQTVVDSESHMLEDYLITDHVIDHGLIGVTVAGIKENAGETMVEVAADKGNHEAEDIYELEIPYEDMGNGTDTVETTGRIKRSLWAGIILEEYQGIVESEEIIKKKVLVKGEI